MEETARNLRFAYRNRTVFLSLLGVSWFWFFGALFLSQVPAFVRDYLGERFARLYAQTRRGEMQDFSSYVSALEYSWYLTTS